MAQILDPLPSDGSEHVLCCYVNATSKMQVARITNIDNWYFERVVFPGQRLLFEALPEAQLEIHTGMMASSILSDTIPCKRLAVSDDPQIPPPEIAKEAPQVKSQVAASSSSILPRAFSGKARSTRTPATALTFAVE
ncbi:MAG: DUF1830 domain-containing protein [Cyanobacteria bacterium P01_A01_bin.123]